MIKICFGCKIKKFFPYDINFSKIWWCAECKKAWKKTERGREYIQEYRKRPHVKAAKKVRDRIYQAFKRYKLTKKDTSIALLGCTIVEFIKYFSDLFTEGMTLEAWDKGLIHMDHFVPLCSARTDEELAKLCHYSNIRPMWARDNLAKSHKDKKYRQLV